jgi:hypothetical protein
VRSIKDECLNRMILIGRASLCRAVSEFMEHYHKERNHQGLENSLIRPAPTHAASASSMQCRPRLGGILNYYYRAAA